MAALWLAGASGAGAQEAGEVNTAPMFGIRAAFDINIPGDWHNSSGSVKMYRQGYGVTLGGVYNVYLGRGFYLEPGVSLFYDSYSYDDLELMADSGAPLHVDPSQYKVGLRVPVVAGYSFDVSDKLSMSVYTGPELSWAFGGGIRVKNKELKDELPGLFDGFHRRVDCAWKIGLGVPYNGFLICMDAAIGMTDLMKNPNISFRENRVAVSVTYYL